MAVAPDEIAVYHFACYALTLLIASHCYAQHCLPSIVYPTEHAFLKAVLSRQVGLFSVIVISQTVQRIDSLCSGFILPVAMNK